MSFQAKGLHDIRALISAPETSIHCAELMGSRFEGEEGSLVIDEKAKRSYQEKIRSLQEDIREAEAMNDLDRASSLNEEYDNLVDHLSKSLGLAGKTRKTGSSVEKARSAVTWRIRSAIKKIGKQHPQLAKHLSHSIKTGTLCSYHPEQSVNWQV